VSPRAASAPAAEIMKGLATTADKIRALAHADCDRTEISKILGIRYQHVRNVMLRSDLSGGMQCKAEAECEPVEVDAVACPFTCPYLPIPTVLTCRPACVHVVAHASQSLTVLYAISSPHHASSPT
jgi:hypothetical protein